MCRICAYKTTHTKMRHLRACARAVQSCVRARYLAFVRARWCAFVRMCTMVRHCACTRAHAEVQAGLAAPCRGRCGSGRGFASGCLCVSAACLPHSDLRAVVMKQACSLSAACLPHSLTHSALASTQLHASHIASRALHLICRSALDLCLPHSSRLPQGHAYRVTPCVTPTRSRLIMC